METDRLSPDTHRAGDVVRLLRLEPLEPEGGFFRRTAAGATVNADGRRGWSTILFLITPDGFSALHRLRSDEVWTFLAGDPVEMLRLTDDGPGGWVTLGPGVSGGQQLQEVVRAGIWQGTRLLHGGRWALVSCVVVPEFVVEDFELADRATLAKRHPRFAPEIAALTRVNPASGSR